MKLNYDIDIEIESPVSKEGNTAEERPELRIVKCCGNCKFFYYNRGHPRTGWCKLFDPNNKEWTMIKQEKWLPAHTTTVCASHIFRHHNTMNGLFKWVDRRLVKHREIEE